MSHDYEFIQEFAPELFWVIGNQTVTPSMEGAGELLDEMSGDVKVKWHGA